MFEILSSPPYGIPYVVIQLYLISFIRHGNPRAELTLKFGHKIRTRSGQPFALGKLTASSIADFQWKPDLTSSFDALVPSVGPSWNDVLPYARQFVDDLRVTADQLELESETQRLFAKLVQTQEFIQQLRSSIQVLERALTGYLSGDDQQALSRIDQQAQSRDTYEAFYEKLRRYILAQMTYVRI